MLTLTLVSCFILENLLIRPIWASLTHTHTEACLLIIVTQLCMRDVNVQVQKDRLERDDKRESDKGLY